MLFCVLVSLAELAGLHDVTDDTFWEFPSLEGVQIWIQQESATA